MNENVKLRIALDALTDLTAEQHLAAVMRIEGHRIKLHRRCSSGNCLSRALIASDPLHVGYMALVERLFQGNTDDGFLNWLNREDQLREAATGALALYYGDDGWKHAGERQRDDAVVSKWGVGWYIYRHPPCEVPLRYGHPRFFEKPDERRALDLFKAFCVDAVGETAFTRAFPGGLNV